MHQRFGRSSILQVVALFAATILGGCAATPTYQTTVYSITSDPPGALVYRGSTPNGLNPYVTTPFTHVATQSTSLGWSENYFQARLAGHSDSDIRRQPTFALGTPTRLHFQLEPNGQQAQAARPAALAQEYGSIELNDTPAAAPVATPVAAPTKRPAQVDEDQLRQHLAVVSKQRANQKCKLVDSEWVYAGAACSSGLAHGKGKALSVRAAVTFNGRFENGALVEGVVSDADGDVYEGAIADGKPHGHGICYFEGEPEECRLHHGKRIDAVHKQRVEFERQRVAMAAMQKRMTELEAAQASTPAAYPVPGGANPTPATPASNPMMASMKSKAASTAVDLLIDALF